LYYILITIKKKKKIEEVTMYKKYLGQIIFLIILPFVL